jgi:HD-GYP domain-containing protein (c-di-GMP phosphodiesterase class II)
MLLVSVDDLRPGMRLGRGIWTADNQLLLGPGVILKEEFIRQIVVRGYTSVWIEDEDTKDVPYQEDLSEATRLAAVSSMIEVFKVVSPITHALRQESLSEVKKSLRSERLCEVIGTHPAIQQLIESIERVVEEILQLDVLSGLQSIRTHDTYTYHHCLDMAVGAMMIGKRLYFSREQMRNLATGCVLHDIGKIFVDDTILNKPGMLDPEEFKRMKDHTVLGYLLLKDTLRIGILPAHIAYQHHERQDGTGYPRGLRGTNAIRSRRDRYASGRITLMGEIAAIADFYDACCSDRPYRKGFPPDRVWQMIRERAGTHFNREIAEVFLSSIPVYPVGISVVVTEGPYRGYRGVVAHVNPTALGQPVVRLLLDPKGKRVEPFEIDLKKDEAQVRGIVREGAEEPRDWMTVIESKSS